MRQHALHIPLANGFGPSFQPTCEFGFRLNGYYCLPFISSNGAFSFIRREF
jgi:hypothetical protein